MTDWATDHVFDSLGTVFQVRSTDPELGEIIDRLMQHFSRTDAPPDHVFSVIDDESGYSVLHGDDSLVEGGSRDRALVKLLGGLNEVAILGQQSLTVHAGAVARGGAVLAFPASENSGKSTLVAACLRNGFEYVSDEALVIDTARDRIVPYPKALWLTDESRAAVQLKDEEVSTRLGDRYKSPVLPHELGGDVASGELELRHVIVLERNREMARLQPIGHSEIAYQLLLHSFNRFERPEDWFRAVSRAARRAMGWRLVYGDPLEAASYIDSHLGML